jgi:hypothetical protein
MPGRSGATHGVQYAVKPAILARIARTELAVGGPIVKFPSGFGAEATKAITPALRAPRFQMGAFSNALPSAGGCTKTGSPALGVERPIISRPGPEQLHDMPQPCLRRGDFRVAHRQTATRGR